MIYWRVFKSTAEKIYFENIPQTRLLDDEGNESVEAFMSFYNFFQPSNSGLKVQLGLQGKC